MFLRIKMDKVKIDSINMVITILSHDASLRRNGKAVCEV